MIRSFNIYYMISVLIVLPLITCACNNPFSTREAQKPEEGGVAIQPANSPENVLYNLEASFEVLSVQDYLDVFSEDFVFNPDPDDSVRFEQDFRNGWDFEKEKIFAENFLQKTSTSEIAKLGYKYEYKPGEDMYDLLYSWTVFPPDSTNANTLSEITKTPYDVKGHAWIYLRENEEGKWKIYKWVERANMIEGAFITWGVLRASNI
ncbi:hypothetical protein ACFL1R_07925 [Candidatus Latescibacterota bacterium]